MRVIGLASQLVDASGAFVLSVLPDTKTREATRRVERRTTLDGGVVITDSGFSHGDRTLYLQIASTESLWAALWSFFTTSATVTVSTDEGCYLAVIERMAEQNGVIEITVLLQENISE